MDVFQDLTDDQIAVIGGIVALAASGAMMYVSYFVGPAGRREPRRSSGELVAERSRAQSPRITEETSRKAA